ncbi:hypothetical protein DENSPDRAFT_667017 [Dentipellis sp. KUC8613]|nr:hypothetical protein DENSPDRAFT_667017 [Dentipellis sp. KUC8613]
MAQVVCEQRRWRKYSASELSRLIVGSIPLVCILYHYYCNITNNRNITEIMILELVQRARPNDGSGGLLDSERQFRERCKHRKLYNYHSPRTDI